MGFLLRVEVDNGGIVGANRQFSTSLVVISVTSSSYVNI
jgi:hypothetical protein